jgi:hypothetical protein
VGRLPEFVQKYYAAVAGVLRDAPWRLDPRVLPQVEVWLDAHREPLWLQPLLERLVETLEYRLTMRRELESASG